MHNVSLWTKLQSRLQLVRTIHDANLNWLFLAGGSGLGSESLDPFIQLLNLPGNIWKLDLPGDGSNITDDDAFYFSNWSAALCEAVSALNNVILVAHWAPDNMPILLFIHTPDFQSSNILIRTISQAAHFPWIENPNDVISVFQEYIKQLNLNG